MSAEQVHLNDPQTLYRQWEESQWNPWEIDLSEIVGVPLETL